MKRDFAMMLFLVIALGSYAGDKVRGELRTEINGFQWYCYKGEQAFSMDGKKLFSDIKGVESIKFSAADKDDKGVFIITYKRKGVWSVCAIDPYTCKILTDKFGGRQPYNMFSVAIMFSNPSHKEYYIKSTHPTYSSSLYYPPKNIEINSQNSFIVKDNFIITDGAYRGASRYDGKNIAGGYLDRIEYQEKAKHFICDVYYPSKSICIIDTLGNKLAENLENVYYKNDFIELLTKNGKRFLISYLGKQIVPPEKGYSSCSMVTINYRTFYRIKYENESHYHLISEDGKDVLGRGYDIIDGFGDNLIKVKDNTNYGIVTLNGREIVPLSRGYIYISDYDSNKRTFAFTKKGVTGFCDAEGREISTTRLAPTADDIKANGGYASAVEMKNGSTKYYKVSRGGRYGLTDSEGKEIVPCEMEALESAGIGYLKYKINGFWGLMNYTGKILIDTDRGYTSIGNFVTFTKRFPYTMAGYKGECDINGRQITKIKDASSNNNVASSSDSKVKDKNQQNTGSDIKPYEFTYETYTHEGVINHRCSMNKFETSVLNFSKLDFSEIPHSAMRLSIIKTNRDYVLQIEVLSQNLIDFPLSFKNVAGTITLQNKKKKNVNTSIVLRPIKVFEQDVFCPTILIAIGSDEQFVDWEQFDIAKIEVDGKSVEIGADLFTSDTIKAMHKTLRYK